MLFGVGGEDLINVLHFELVSPSSLTDAQVLSDIGEVLELIYAPMVAITWNQVQYADYTVKNVSTVDAPNTAVWPTFTVGGNATQATPPSNAALILARTNVSKKQGRVFVPGLTEAEAGAGVWSIGALTQLTIFGANLLLTHVATNGNYRYGVVTAAVPFPKTILNSFDVPISTAVVTPIRTQRRRALGIGS